MDVSRTATKVIVAPHAALRPIADDPMRVAGVLRRSVCLSTSRLGSGALGADRPYHAGAAASVALSRDASRYLTAHGVPTHHLKPGSHPSLRSSSTGSRTITVGAHARYSIYREELLARSRDVLDAHACDLRISTVPADLPPGLLAPREWLPWLREPRRPRLAADRARARHRLVRGDSRDHEWRTRSDDRRVRLRAARAG